MITWWGSDMRYSSSAGNCFKSLGLCDVHLDAANRFSLSIVSGQVWLEKSG